MTAQKINHVSTTDSLTLTTPSNIEVEVDPTSGYTSGSFYAWGNTLTNTLDGENYHSGGSFKFFKLSIPLGCATWFSDGTNNLTLN